MLTKEKINQIKNVIVKNIDPEKIYLFGSYADNTAKEHSDIDLVVIINSDLNPHQRNMSIRRLFPKRDFSLDVFAYTPEEEKKYKDVKSTILYSAAKKGIVLYERQ